MRPGAAVRLCATLACLCLAQAARPATETVSPWQKYIVSPDTEWAAGEQYFRNAIVEHCKAGQPDLKRLAFLHYCHDICRYFPHIEAEALSAGAQQRFASWLLANRELNEPLLLALGPRDELDRAFEVLRQLASARDRSVKELPQLAIAFAVVWDGEPYEKQELVESFDYFARSAGRLVFNPRATSYQVMKYFVDTRTPVSERLWALRLYAGRTDLALIHRGIRRNDRVDWDGNRAERPLKHIRKYGGWEYERARYVREVGKALGIPCVRLWAQTEQGRGQSWLAFVRRRGARYVWDSDVDRSSGESALVGSVRDPQDGRHLTEHELAHALAALRHPEDARRRAQIWCEVARILAGAGAATQARAAMLESLNECVYDRSQWHAFAELARNGIFSHQQTVAAMEKFTDKLRDYPELAVDAFGQLAGALQGADPAQRLALYDKMARDMRPNKGCVGRIRLMKGRFLEQQGKRSAALSAYAGSALQSLDCKRALLPLLDNAARLMLEDKQTSRAVELHKRTFGALKRPQRPSYVVYQTAWFQVGLRLAKLHELAGQKADHDQLVSGLLRYHTGSGRGAQRTRERARSAKYLELNRTRPPGTSGR